MNRLVKIGVVLSGYVVAFVVASEAVAIRIAHTSGPDAQASAGMYAFGDAVLFVAVFGVLAIIPTALALYFLRSYPTIWTVLGAAAVVFAVTGFLATVVYVSASHLAGPRSVLELGAAFAVLRMLPSPLFALGFAVALVLAPHAMSRRLLLYATTIEGAVATYTVFHWFIRCSFA